MVSLSPSTLLYPGLWAILRGKRKILSRNARGGSRLAGIGRKTSVPKLELEDEVCLV